MKNCPICNAWVIVKETRSNVDYTYRRYECGNLHRFSTNEIVVPDRNKVNPKELLAALRSAAKMPTQT